MNYLKRTGTCTADNCDLPVQARQLCNRHYVASWRAKQAEKLDAHRTWAKIEKELRG